MKDHTWNEIPCILAEINLGIQCIVEMMQGGKQAAQPEKTTEQAPAPAPEATAAEPTAPAHEAVTHESLKALCLKLNRLNADNKPILTSIIARYTPGKIVDVPSDKLDELWTDINAECIHVKK